jgi:glyoxylase-like metal-dependent hydrolase (beta-lactamase superfamily II)
MKLYVLDGGRAHLPDMSHLTPDRNVGKPVTIPILMFLIDHPQGLVVFDTGLDIDRIEDPCLEVLPDQRLDRQIRRLGYEPGEVKYVVVSHLHLDHVGCMPLFPEATFVVRRQELRAAWWPDEYERGYDFDTLLRTRHLKYLQPGTDETFDLFGEGSLVCIDTKGHTEGHQSLVVSLPDSGKIVLAGDAAQVLENFTDKVPPGMCWSSRHAVESIQKLQHLEAQGALVILGHELSALGTLRLAPDCYE